MVKLSFIQLGIATMFIGVLVPIPGLSHSLNQSETAKYPNSILLTQVASYRSLVDAANREEQLANQAAESFFATLEQFGNAPNQDRAVKFTNVLIKTSGQAAVYFQRNSELGLQSLPYYAGDLASAQTALDIVYRIQGERSQIYRSYNQLSQQIRSAMQAGDGTRVNVLLTKFAMLNERKSQLDQLNQQVTQAYKNRSNAVNAQLLNNLNTQMRNGLIQRGRATKCMVSNLPYGSPAQVANNASGYCNAP